MDVYLVDWITVTDVAVLETVVCYTIKFPRLL